MNATKKSGDESPHSKKRQPINRHDRFGDKRQKHAAIGGPKGRRMFAISFKAAPANDGQRILADYKKASVKECREAKPVVA